MSRSLLKKRLFWHTGVCLIIGVLIGMMFAGNTNHAPTDDKKAQMGKASSHWTCSMHPQIDLPKPGKCPICGMDLIPRKKETQAVKKQEWTCSMHPQIKMKKPGKCPICGMDLVPLKSSSGSGESSGSELKMSDYAAELAEIEVDKVRRDFVTRSIDMFGEVDYDESSIAYITSWVSGRIEELFISETGVPVNDGDHIAELYSPELLSAQEEYLQALKGDEKVSDSHLEVIRSSSKNTIKNAKEKLLLLGVREEQLQKLKTTKRAQENITVFSAASGIVLEKMVEEGDYVKTGQRLYSVADLKKLWVRLDAYESDLEWIRYGQEVSFEVEAYPGKSFHGLISFISPVLDRKTRTVKVRVNVDNTDLLLKPGMFVRAQVKSGVAQGGLVIDESLTDKWMCSMHPSIIKGEKGDCPICGMHLVSADELGYSNPSRLNPPLIVPVTAVLKTGKRAVVYVRKSSGQGPVFQGREVALGPRAGDYYIIRQGLKEGEEVVTKGNFKIDSALQIEAKPSMMNPSDSMEEKPKGMSGGMHHAH